MSEATNYDAIVIGAGQAGVPLCTALAKSGRRTLLIERKQVGGTCINEGCTPTKTMVASARVAYLARRGADYGVQTGPIRVDLARVRERKRNIVESFRSGSQRRIETADGVDLVFGEARFTAPRAVAVNGRRLRGELVFINTGGRPAPPEVPGLDQVAPLDSTSIMELDQVPEHLIVLGGGYIGLEF
ncbi:MAG: FAD-dependent oxidoreductase, partial [Gemmatimonadales bacterium]